MTWPEIKQTISEGRLEKLGRSSANLVVYRKFGADTNEKWVSTWNYVLVSKLSLGSIVDPESGKLKANMEEYEQTRDVRFNFSLNDYPYNFEEGVYHYILWKIGSDITNEDISKYETKAREIHGSVESITFLNPPHLKSIKNVDHAHILCFKPLQS